MATARSLELQALARHIADGLPGEIDEVLLTGSASRGVADLDSDFEMLLVGETLPPPAEIAAALDVFDVDEMPERDGWWIGGTVEGEPYAEWQERLRTYPDALAEAIVLDAIGDWTEQTPRGICGLLRAHELTAAILAELA